MAYLLVIGVAVELLVGSTWLLAVYLGGNDAIGCAYLQLSRTAINTMGSAQEYSFASKLADIAANENALHIAIPFNTTQKIAAYGLEMYARQVLIADTVDAAIDLIEDLAAFTKTVGDMGGHSLEISAEIACQKLLPLIAKEEGMNEAYDYAERLQNLYTSYQKMSCAPALDFMAQNLEVLQKQAGMEIAIQRAMFVGADYPDDIAFTSGHLEEIFYQATDAERKTPVFNTSARQQPVQDFYQPLSDTFKAIAQPLFRANSVRKKGITVSCT